MPPELRKAHQQNDRAVMHAYGFDVKTTTETSCVAELMKMYQNLSIMTSASLTGKNHTLTITFSNGAHLSYTFQTVELSHLCRDRHISEHIVQGRIVLALETDLAPNGQGFVSGLGDNSFNPQSNQHLAGPTDRSENG